ncbi:MAG: class B sortase [Lachnospiraceae bacterium]|nr:class B sortase [Lachnospiraceae bacterium]MDD7076998.1 class B sortase [Lachnospiraceae bacterium]MDY3729989.1 class B sortase [Candidatus Choladocola sp.]
MSRRKKRRTTFGDIMSTLLMLIALVVFIFSGYTLYGFYKEYQKGSNEYDNLESSYASDEGESEDLDALEDEAALQDISGREVANIIWDGKELTVPTMKNPIDFSELQQVNEDIAGWLRIRALDISYPVVQGEDNDYYLHRTFEKEDNFAGCLFVNCDNDRDFTDQNTIIYGHNMKNGSMFGKLKQFREEETYNKSKYFWMFTPDLIFQYRIFSAMVVNKTGLAYQTFYSDEDFNEWINKAFEGSEVENSGIQVTSDDHVVTLSTCTGDDSTRFVVMGKLVQIYASK